MKVLITLLLLGVAAFGNAAEFGISHNNEDHNGLSEIISKSIENHLIDKLFKQTNMEDKIEYNDETNAENLTNILNVDDIEKEYKYYKNKKQEALDRYNKESDKYNHMNHTYEVVKSEYDDANNELHNMRHYDRRYTRGARFDFQNKMEHLYDSFSYYSHQHENALNDYLLVKNEYQDSVNKYNHAKLRYDDAANGRREDTGDPNIKDNKRDKRDGVDTTSYYKIMWANDGGDVNYSDDDGDDDDDDNVKGKGNYLTFLGVLRDGNKKSLDGRPQDLGLPIEDTKESVQDIKEDKLGFDNKINIEMNEKLTTENEQNYSIMQESNEDEPINSKEDDYNDYNETSDTNEDVGENNVALDLSSSLRQCRVNNNIALNSCLIQTMEDLRPHLRTGVPELSLPVLEPMFIPNLNFRQGNGAVNINAIFRNLEIRGLSTFNTTYIDADPHSQTLNVGLYIPELRITGNYDLDGLLLVLPIKGQGPFWCTFTGIHANGIGNIDIVDQAPTERLQVSNVYVNFDINRMRVKLDNLFGGDPILGETVHHFLNENGKEVLAEIKPEIQRRLNELVQKVMNDAFSQLPVDAFLLRN